MSVKGSSAKVEQINPDDQVLDYIRYLNQTNIFEEQRRDNPASA